MNLYDVFSTKSSLLYGNSIRPKVHRETSNFSVKIRDISFPRTWVQCHRIETMALSQNVQSSMELVYCLANQIPLKTNKMLVCTKTAMVLAFVRWKIMFGYHQSCLGPFKYITYSIHFPAINRQFGFFPSLIRSFTFAVSLFPHPASNTRTP